MHDDRDRGIEETQGANASLIAAAPDLAEALEGLLRRTSHAYDCAAWDHDAACECGHLCNCGLDAALAAARAALAKARGER
jgi:hypothetical protein